VYLSLVVCVCVCSLLNRVTVENFDTLKKDIFTLASKNDVVFQGLIERIFDKAVLEKHFWYVR
jgi:hypothetical protein